MTLTTADKPLDLPTLRQALDLTQVELAKALKVNVRTVRRWEQGAPMHIIWQDRLTAMYRKHHPHEEVPG